MSGAMDAIKYDRIGLDYNNTRQADPYLVSRIFSLLNPVHNNLYLDIGCGTGNYTIALSERGVSLVGVEPSEKMISVAKLRSQKVKWLNGFAEQIPAGKNMFNGAIATLTMHHWSNLSKAFSEISRVLADNSRLVILTSTPEQMRGYWLNHYFPQMMMNSIAQMPSLDRIKKESGQSSMEIIQTEKYFVSDDLQDLFLHAGKNKPEIYFDEKIRKGISAFAALSTAEEVAYGLAKLKEDLGNGTFKKIKEQYRNEAGDYLFVVMKKSSRQS